jgi:hypothetical protein
MGMTKYLSLLAFFFAAPAFAYHLGDHAKVTHQAYLELARCFPSASALLDLEFIDSGNREEDLNLLTKELFYSHFYNPHKRLKMRRADSAGRIADLQPILRRASFNRIDVTEMINLGHVVHHYQDATVPSHVVPVNHSFFDGFETLEVDGDLSSGYNCEAIASMNEADLNLVLKETAEQTLTNLSALSFDVLSTEDGVENRIPASGKAFWVESSNNDFGKYGFLGNNFGETNFRAGKTTYSIDASVAPNFKRQQMKLAVQATLRGLMWELGPVFTKDKKDCQPDEFMAAQND